DRRGATRTVPMRVLVLGFCRIGTAPLLSALDSLLTRDIGPPVMRTALETLGYKHTYHMQDVLADPHEADFWTEAIDAKFEGMGTPFGRAEWDQLLGHCQAVTDVPAILFSEELIAAYAQQDASTARLAAHYASVKAMVPEERLLEVEVGEGWGRLCAFLGEEVPQDAFPRTND
ncbi:hypothetical protein FB451DRAFT_948267, partial [Mycena latifolia]